MKKSKVLTSIALFPLLAGCGNTWNVSVPKEVIEANLSILEDQGIQTRTHVKIENGENVISVFEATRYILISRKSGNYELVSMINGTIVLTFSASEYLKYSISEVDCLNDSFLEIVKMSGTDYVSINVYDKFTNVVYSTTNKDEMRYGFNIKVKSNFFVNDNCNEIIIIEHYDTNTSKFVKTLKEYKSNFVLGDFNYSEYSEYKNDLTPYGYPDYQIEIDTSGDRNVILKGYYKEEHLFSTTLNVEKTNYNSTIDFQVGRYFVYQTTIDVDESSDFDCNYGSNFYKVHTYCVDILTGEQSELENFKYLLLTYPASFKNSNYIYELAYVPGALDFSKSKYPVSIVSGVIDSFPKFTIIESSCLPIANIRVGENYLNYFSMMLSDSAMRPLGTVNGQLISIVGGDYALIRTNSMFGIINQQGSWVVEPAYSDVYSLGYDKVALSDNLFTYIFDSATEKLEVTSNNMLFASDAGFMVKTPKTGTMFEVVRDDETLFSFDTTVDSFLDCGNVQYTYFDEYWVFNTFEVIHTSSSSIDYYTYSLKTIERNLFGD